MAERIHLVVELAEKERFRRAATREGKSLSEWLRAAAQERLAGSESSLDLRTRDGLRAFFEEVDREQSGDEAEPDWEVQKELLAQSRIKGLPRP